MRQLYTRQQVAEHFRVSTKTIQRWVRAKKLTAVRVGQRTLFTAEDVDALIEASRMSKAK